MARQIHEAAQKGFEAGAQAYERGRPDYPAAAVARLARECGLSEGPTNRGPELAVDLGAGTGKFTRLLAHASAARLVAVEPVAAMREQLARALGLAGVSAEILHGTAEAIPLPAGAAQAVFAAQAFHWFNGRAALREIQRVLKPGGALGLLWNRRDERSDLMAALTAIVDPYEKGAPRYRTGEWRKAFEEPDSGFSPLQRAEYPHIQSGPPEIALDRIGSISFISALPRIEQEHVLDQVRSLIAVHPETRGRSSVEFRYVTDLYWCHASSQA